MVVAELPSGPSACMNSPTEDENDHDHDDSNSGFFQRAYLNESSEVEIVFDQSSSFEQHHHSQQQRGETLPFAVSERSDGKRGMSSTSGGVKSSQGRNNKNIHDKNNTQQEHDSNSVSSGSLIEPGRGEIANEESIEIVAETTAESTGIPTIMTSADLNRSDSSRAGSVLSTLVGGGRALRSKQRSSSSTGSGGLHSHIKSGLGDTDTAVQSTAGSTVVDRKMHRESSNAAAEEDAPQPSQWRNAVTQEKEASVRTAATAHLQSNDSDDSEVESVEITAPDIPGWTLQVDDDLGTGSDQEEREKERLASFAPTSSAKETKIVEEREAGKAVITAVVLDTREKNSFRETIPELKSATSRNTPNPNRRDEKADLPVDDRCSESNSLDDSGNEPAGSEAEDKKPDEKTTKTPAIKKHSKFHIFRHFCGKIINDDRVQTIMIFLIIINALMMGVATFDFVSENPHRSSVFATIDTVFLCIFTVELAMQATYHGMYLFTDGWLFFDFAVIVLTWSLQQLQVVRAFRVFRAFRLITRLSILRNLVEALFAVAPSMGAIIALLLLILYIYAVMCTVLFRDLYKQGVTDEDYFSRLDTTLFTLFQMMTLEWSWIVRQVMEKYYYAWAIFSTFLVMTSFILYSLIIAVVCDAVKVTEHQDEEEIEVALKESTRQRMFFLQKRLDEMSESQSIALTAIERALEQLNDNAMRSAGQGPRLSMVNNQNAENEVAVERAHQELRPKAEGQTQTSSSGARKGDKEITSGAFAMQPIGKVADCDTGKSGDNEDNDDVELRQHPDSVEVSDPDVAVQAKEQKRLSSLPRLGLRRTDR